MNERSIEGKDTMALPSTTRGTLTKPKAEDAHFQKILRLWYAYNFFLAPIKDGLAPFLSVYLVAFAGVSVGEAGLIWFAKDIAQMTSQIPMGVLVDRTIHKKAFLVFFTLLTTLLPILVVFTQRTPLLVARSIVEGIGVTGLMVFKGPFTLGIAGHESFEQAAKYTEISEHMGSLVVFSLAGIVGYFTYPNVSPIFYVIGAFGSVSTVCLLLMLPKEKDNNIIDDDVARNSFHAKPIDSSIHFDLIDSSSHDHHVKSVNSTPEFPDRTIEEENLSRAFNESVQESELGERTTSNEKTSESENDYEEEDNSHSSSASSKKVLESESIWNIFVTNKAMSFFVLSVFFFHLSNAAVLPLLGQILALEEGKNGIPYTSSLIGIAQITSMGGIYMLEFFTNRGCTINVPIMIAFGAVIPRICCILVLLNFSRNPYALLATQIFDGLGAGVNGLAILRVTKTLTENTNRFGLVFSIANTSHAFGAALSNLVAGYLVDLTSYEIALVTLLAPGVLCLIFLSVTKVGAPPVKGADETLYTHHTITSIDKTKIGERNVEE